METIKIIIIFLCVTSLCGIHYVYSIYQYKKKLKEESRQEKKVDLSDLEGEYSIEEAKDV